MKLQMLKSKIYKKVKNICTEVVRKTWRIINGNKTLIGVVLLYLDSLLFQDNGEASFEIGRFAIYLWTGVGVGHKVKKQFSKISVIR